MWTNRPISNWSAKSANLFEISLQYLEQKQTINILKKPRILSYIKHVDITQIIYNTKSTLLSNTPVEFNSLLSQLNFTIKDETISKQNYQRITTTNHHYELEFDTFRKSSTTVIVIHNDTFHPYKHKHLKKSYQTTWTLNQFPIKKT